MIPTVDIRRCFSIAVFATIAAATAMPVSADEDKSDGKWHFTVTPYLWFPDVNGSVTYTNPGGANASVSADIYPSSYLESLDFAGMISAEARKDNWLIFTDYIYVHTGGHDSGVKSITGPGGLVTVPVNVGGSNSLVTNVWTLAGGYRVLHEPAVSLDLFAGTRLLSLSAAINWDFSGPTGGLARAGNVKQTLTEWDGIVGLRGEVRFGEGKWFMPYYVDVGGGSSNWTWAGTLGVGYRFSWGDAILAVQTLQYDFSDHHDLSLRMTGPALGVAFRF